MAYRDFTLPSAIRQFTLIEKRETRFPQCPTLESSAWLVETLGLSVDFALASASEKARSEFIVVPILLELERRNQKRFAIHSGWRQEKQFENWERM